MEYESSQNEDYESYVPEEDKKESNDNDFSVTSEDNMGAQQ